jgi:hypothetical protein
MIFFIQERYNLHFTSKTRQLRKRIDIPHSSAPERMRPLQFRAAHAVRIVDIHLPFPGHDLFPAGDTKFCQDILPEFVIPGREMVVPGKREVYVHYPDGMGRSKLKWPLSLREGRCGISTRFRSWWGWRGKGSLFDQDPIPAIKSRSGFSMKIGSRLGVPSVQQVMKLFFQSRNDFKKH